MAENNKNKQKEPRKSKEKSGYKTIFIVFVLVSFAYVIPASFNSISTAIGTTYNPTNPNIYENANTLKYEYEPGKIDEKESLTLTVEPDDEKKYAEVEVKIDDKTETTFECDIENGYVKGTEKYSLFWIFTENNVLDLTGTLLKDDKIEVMDPAGILGAKNANYTFVFVKKMVYYDVPPKLLGAQYSFIVDIYDSSEQKVASATIDSTSGILELIDGTSDLSLQDPGNYPMSRHRLTFLWVSIIVTILVPILGYLYFQYKKQEDERTVEDLTLLLAFGCSAVLFDFIIDVWFYAAVGILPMLIIHFIVAGIYASICAFRLKLNPLWLTPLYLEIALAIALNLHTAVPYYPSMLVAIGSFASFLIVLYRMAQLRPIF